MGLTVDQIQAVWMEQQRSNNPRYKFMTPGEKQAFNAELELIFEESKEYLIQRYGDYIGDYGAEEDYEDSGVDPVYPPGGTEQIGGVLVQLEPGIEKHVSVYTSDDGDPLLYNLNFYNINDAINVDFENQNIISADNNMIRGSLEDVWVYNYDPHIPEVPVSTATAADVEAARTGNVTGVTGVGSSKVVGNPVIHKRASGSMDTFDPTNPDQFDPNEYFWRDNNDGTITWFNKYDPMLRFKWSGLTKSGGLVIKGVLESENRLELDLGLNQGSYNIDHPEYIEPGWSLESSGSGEWVWQFDFSDPTYRIHIIQQADNTYRHSWSGAKISFEEWYAKYVGDYYT